MQGISEEFSVGLGDLREIDAGSKPPGNGNGETSFSTLGSAEYVAKYKKALLNRRTVFKEVLKK